MEGRERNSSPSKENPTSPPPNDHTKPRKSKLRFKNSSRSKHHRRSPSTERKHDSHHHSRSRHRHRSSRSSHTQPQFQDSREVSPETAFRESLFDALGDDEGADYWASVYGQPIHTYAVPEVPKGPDGHLEQMDDEEYTAYVRAEMWKRTREGMLEEQERVRAARAREQERMRMRQEELRGTKRQRGQADREAFERVFSGSLQRGEKRRMKKKQEEMWDTYVKRWKEVERAAEAAAKGERGGQPLRNLLFWPVDSGKRRDVQPDAVQKFMKAAPGEDLLATLKAERIKWHPDKIQHRFHVLGIDEVVLRSVTEVFQIVDRMWNEEREKAK
ncbi:hypothetical protein N7470_005921 [Penicillium chermesinum]|nr:hypothetical protein N7470_005921 [Penicillium chermesinum]